MGLLARIFRRLFEHDAGDKNLSRDERFAATIAQYNAKAGDKLDSASVVDTMKFFGLTDTSMAERKRVAEYYGIKNYTGTAAQNSQWRDLILDDYYGD